MFLKVAIVCLGLAALAHAQKPECVGDAFQIIPKLDCKGYFMCVYGNPVEMPDCPVGSVFSTLAHVCVPENSNFDDCKREGNTCCFLLIFKVLFCNITLLFLSKLIILYRLKFRCKVHFVLYSEIICNYLYVISCLNLSLYVYFNNFVYSLT